MIIKLPSQASLRGDRAVQRGSVLVLVLCIALGLVAITLYFANSMSLELRTADNRVAAMAADQAIEGASRYVCYLLSMLQTNGMIPDPTTYPTNAIPVGDARFWFIGRADPQLGPQTEPVFGLIDEASKLNINTASEPMLELLPGMTPDLAACIVDWRDADSDISPNGAEVETYARLDPPYLCKNANFESVDELRMVYGMNMGFLLGEDLNRNGVLDVDEVDTNHNGLLDPGLLEYVTVFSREPNTRSDGTARINVNSQDRQPLTDLLQSRFSSQRANQIIAGMGTGRRAVTFSSPMQFGLLTFMTPDEFALIARDITTTNGSYVEGRVNINTARAEVLACIPGIGVDRAPDVVNYRLNNSAKLTSVLWLADALGSPGAAMQAGPYVTTQAYQFSADVAAVGPHGRGYRRVRFVIDISDGTPRIVYRQDLSQLGWALGKQVRQRLLLAKASR